ncbi:MAG: sulfatase, partial [Acidimicrobiia bacterium]|nr:sulfatase [Acidimicrobiia bacterium]
LVTATHRYTRQSAGEDGLYELGTEDDECTNLATTDLTLRHEMVDRLADALLRHSDSARGLQPASP